METEHENMSNAELMARAEAQTPKKLFVQKRTSNSFYSDYPERVIKSKLCPKDGQRCIATCPYWAVCKIKEL